MGKRDLMQIANKLKGQYAKNKYLSCYYDLSLDELCSLTELAQADPVKAVIVSFQAGMVIGGRARAKKRLPVL